MQITPSDEEKRLQAALTAQQNIALRSNGTSEIFSCR
jgi:hypothetical protein